MDCGKPETKEEIERRKKEERKRCDQRIKERKKKVIKSIMSLGCSKREANEVLEKLGPAFGQKMKEAIKEVNTSLQGKKTSKNPISQSLIRRRLARSGR